MSSYLTIRRHFSRALDLKEVVIGGGGDTGADAIAIIVNGSLMTDVDQVQEMLEQNGYLEATFIFVQAERSAKFDGAKIGTMGNGIQDFFRDVPQMTQNDDVKDAAEIRAAIYDRAPNFRRRPSCYICYVTTGKWTNDADLVARKNAETSKLDETEMFDVVSFVPYGADDIMRLHTSAKNAVTRTFTFDQKVQVPSVEGVHLAFLGHISAKDFVKIIADDAGDDTRNARARAAPARSDPTAPGPRLAAIAGCERFFSREHLASALRCKPEIICSVRTLPPLRLERIRPKVPFGE